MSNTSKGKKQEDQVLHLLSAVEEGDLTRIRTLLQQTQRTDTIVNGSNKHGETPLHIAAGYGRLMFIKLLHQKGAILDLTDQQGDTPLYWAARHGHLEAVKYLCAHKVNVNHQDKAGETAAHVAARYGHPEVLAHLCQVGGSNPNLQDKDGETPLLCACWHGYPGVVKCLVKLAFSSMETVNNEGESPLHVAAVRGYDAIVRFLCKSGARLNVVDNSGCAPIHLAVRRNHLNIMKCLIEHGCNLEIQDKNGETPLHYACKEDKLSLVQVLCATGKLNLTTPNNNGASPLHIAAKYGHMEVARYLCFKGCDVNAVTENGFTADEVAANSGHDDLASFIHRLRQNGSRDRYASELNATQDQLSKVKLLVCGAAGVGKTELIGSLRSTFFQGLFRRRAASNLINMLLKRTHGMSVQNVSVPNAGEFTIFDFSGLKDYYLAHENFLDGANAIVVLVFSLRDPIEKQLAQVHFWLSMLKAKQAPAEGDTMRVHVRYAGKPLSRPPVLLIGSFADQQKSPALQRHATASGGPFDAPLASSINQPCDNGLSVLQMVVRDFGKHFDMQEEVHTLDCRLTQSREMRALRLHLGALKSSVLQSQPRIPPLVHTLSLTLPQWRAEHSDFPVLAWTHFHQLVQELVNPLASTEHIKLVASALHNTGEVVYIDQKPLNNIVVLDPNWLGMKIFGPALSPENSIFPQLKSVTGRVSLQEMSRVYQEWDAVSLARLFEHFELSVLIPSPSPLLSPPSAQTTGGELGSSGGECTDYYEFPALIQVEPLFGLWAKETTFKVYAGARVVCSCPSDSYTPGVFPRIQVRMKKQFSNVVAPAPSDEEEQDLVLWCDGLKLTRGNVEAQVTLLNSATIEVLARSTDDRKSECYTLLLQCYSTVTSAVRELNPGLRLSTQVLSSQDLREHGEKPMTYRAVDVFAAERGDGVLRVHSPEGGGQSVQEKEEDILDLICCGCEELLVTVKSAPYASLKDIPIQSYLALCQSLDLPDLFGRDWCLLGLQLGMAEEIPSVYETRDGYSPTDKILKAWDRAGNHTIVDVFDALVGIGREDAAEILVEGLSPYTNPSSPVVVNIPGIANTSFKC